MYKERCEIITNGENCETQWNEIMPCFKLKLIDYCPQN